MGLLNKQGAKITDGVCKRGVLFKGTFPSRTLRADGLLWNEEVDDDGNFLEIDYYEDGRFMQRKEIEKPVGV